MPRQARRVVEETLAHLEARDDGRGLGVRDYAEFGTRLATAVADDLVESGVDRESIRTDHRSRVEGGYAPTAGFTDVVALDDEGLPRLLIEVVATLSSVGNNLSNRMNEVLASATNIARAFDGAERAPYKPCVALIFIIRGTTSNPSATSMTDRWGRSVKIAGSAFSRMLDDGILDAVCLLVVNHEEAKVVEPYDDQTFDAFIRRIEQFSERTQVERSRGSLGTFGLGRAFALGSDVAGVVSGLTSTPAGLSAAEGAVIRERRRVVAELQELALDPDVNETAMHRAIGSHYWLFGGQYVGVVDRRSLMPLDQYDIPLLCADGSLEVIELKGPEADIVTRHRNHLIVADDVHRAVSQCLNYLRSLDELGPGLTTHYKNELGIDFDLRRSKGTVIVGHPGRESRSGATRAQTEQTIRSYNSHLSRLRVLTYADLLDSAERALRFAAE